MTTLEKNDQYKLIQEWLTSGFQLFTELHPNKKTALDNLYAAARDYRHDTLLGIND